MPVSLLIRRALALTLLFAGSLLGVAAAARSLPVVPQAHDALFMQSSTCADTFCVLGIIPGVMTMQEAVDALEVNPWVANLRYYRGMEIDSGFFYWEWTGEQPAYIDPFREGALWFRHGVVRWVEVATRVRFGDLWMLRGAPNTGRLHTTSAEPPRVYQFVTYDAGHLTSRTDVMCPVNAAAYWRAHVTLRINSVDESYQVQVREPDPWQMPKVSGCG